MVIPWGGSLIKYNNTRLHWDHVIGFRESVCLCPLSLRSLHSRVHLRPGLSDLLVSFVRSYYIFPPLIFGLPHRWQRWDSLTHHP